jgi:hypothetical protein
MKKLIVLAASRLFPGSSPMKITRRFAAASLLVIAVAIVLGAPAPASAGRKTYDGLTLYPAVDSPFPQATGTVTLYHDSGLYYSVFAVSVSVSKLARNASYYMPVTVLDPWWGTTWVENIPIQTDARGKGGGGWSGLNRGHYGWGGYYNYYITTVTFQVCDGSGTLVLTPNP